MKKILFLVAIILFLATMSSCSSSKKVKTDYSYENNKNNADIGNDYGNVEKSSTYHKKHYYKEKKKKWKKPRK